MLLVKELACLSDPERYASSGVATKVYNIMPMDGTRVIVLQTMPLGYQAIFHCTLVLSSARRVLLGWTMFTLAIRGNKKDEKLFRIDIRYKEARRDSSSMRIDSIGIANRTANQIREG